MSATEALVRFERIGRSYGTGESEVKALDSIDLAIMPGEFVAIMGPSGSGKSTAMNIMGCLDRPTSGRYFFSGLDITGLDGDGRALLRRNFLGFVFQGYNLLARTSAIENVELPLVYRGVPRTERRDRAIAALQAVGLAARARHTPAELSGGQQQRVAIARAIVSDPLLLLADEPTGNLDTARSVEIMELIAHLNAERGITVVMVTHEPDMAAHARRTVHFLDGRIASDALHAEAA